MAGRNAGMLWLLLILLSVCLTGGKLAYSYLQSMQTLEQRFQDIYTEQNFYRICDQFLDEYEDYDRPENHELLCRWNELLHESGVLSYIELNCQYFNWQQGAAESVCKGVYVGKNYFDEFPAEPADGRLFEATDFAWEEGEALPVILGADYIGKYELGETFWARTPFLYGKACIIGFLPENTFVYQDGALLNIDSHIVAPMIDFMDKPAKEQPGTLVYMKNLGIVKTGMSRNEAQEYVYALCKRIGMPPVFYIQGATNQQTGALGASMEKIVQISVIMMLVFLVLLVALMCIHVMLKLRRNWNYYSVLYLNGFSSGEVFCIMTGDLFLLLILANLVTEVIYQLWMGIADFGKVPLYYNLVISVILLVVPMLIAWRGFHRKDLCSRLGDTEGCL